MLLSLLNLFRWWEHFYPIAIGSHYISENKTRLVLSSTKIFHFLKKQKEFSLLWKKRFSQKYFPFPTIQEFLWRWKEDWDFRIRETCCSIVNFFNPVFLLILSTNHVRFSVPKCEWKCSHQLKRFNNANDTNKREWLLFVFIIRIIRIIKTFIKDNYTSIRIIYLTVNLRGDWVELHYFSLGVLFNNIFAMAFSSVFSCCTDFSSSGLP